MKEDKKYYCSLLFKEKVWYIGLSSDKDTFNVDSELISYTTKLLGIVDCLTPTDKPYLFEIKPFDGIIYSIQESLRVLSHGFLYSGRLSNVIKSSNLLKVLSYVDENKELIINGTYPVVNTVKEKDIDKILDIISIKGKSYLTVTQEKMLEHYAFS